ncbi:MAG: hypothetical protein QOI01_6742 [Mycobacterium sp.]|nr:hypothetical protein [Mycobacterium sp.]
MAQALFRITAGLGIVAAVSVVGGLGAAVTSADPGGSRSPSSHSYDGGHSRGNGEGTRGRGRGPRDGDRGGDHGRDGSGGSGRSGAGDPRGDDDRLPTVVAGRGTSKESVGQTATPSRLAAVEPSTSDAVPDTPTIPVATSGAGSSGRSGAGQVTTPIVVPRVTFGNGRSPGLSSEGPDERPGPVEPGLAIVLPAAAAPAPGPAPAPASVPRTVWAPDTPVASLWAPAHAGWPASVIFGIAGLLLAPIGGIWLGQRNARASKSASELVGS